MADSIFISPRHLASRFTILSLSLYPRHVRQHGCMISEFIPGCELADVQAGFRKGRGTRDQIANIRWIMEKAR